MDYGTSFSIILVCYFFGVCVVQVKAHYFDCVLLIQPYIECKHLNEITKGYENYDRNNGLLNATLANIRLEEALDMQRHIYVLLTNNSVCASDLCRCLNGDIKLRSKETPFGFALRDDNVYAQFKRIILDYANEYGMAEMSLDEKIFTRNFKPDEIFCSRYDLFSEEGTIFYSFNGAPCLNQFTNPVCN